MKKITPILVFILLLICGPLWGADSIMVNGNKTIVSPSGALFFPSTLQISATGAVTMNIVTNKGPVREEGTVYWDALTASRLYGTDSSKQGVSYSLSPGLNIVGTTLSLDLVSLTTDGTPDLVNDYLFTYDVSAGTYKKILISSLPGGGGGEANTGSNLGASGFGMFYTKSGINLGFNNILAGSGLNGASNNNVITLSIPSAGVTSAMFRDSVGLSLIGRSANSTGVPADIAAASDGQTMRRSGATIGFGALDLASANSVTGILPAGNVAGTVASGVTDSMFRNSAGMSVIGRSVNSSGAPTDIAAATDGQVFRRSGTSIGFGQIDLANANALGGILPAANVGGTVASAVTDAMFRNSAALSLIGRSANSSGSPADIAAASDGQVMRRSGTAIGFGSIDLASANSVTGILPAANVAGTVAAGVTSAMIRNSVGVSVIGRSANSTGVPADIAAANDNELLRRVGGVLGFGLIDGASIGGGTILSQNLTATNTVTASNIVVQGSITISSYNPPLANLDWSIRPVYFLNITENTNLTMSGISTDRGILVYVTNALSTMTLPSYINWPSTSDGNPPALETNCLTIYRFEKIGSSGFTNGFVVATKERKIMSSIASVDYSVSGVLVNTNGVVSITQFPAGSSPPDDTAFASSWNGVTTTAPSKNAVYDWAHIFDTDDDGKVNVLDMGAGVVKTDAGGVVSVASLGTDYIDPSYISDTAFASSWNGVTTIAATKNAVYDWGHLFDTDDDGKVNVLDMGAGIVKTDSGGVVSAAAAGTDYLAPSAISDTAFASSWDTVTTISPSKNAIYDWAHLFDTDDDGKVNVLDMGAGVVKTDSSGVVSAATAGTDYTTPTSTESFQNKTFDAAATGNTLKLKDYIFLRNFDNATGVTIPNTNDVTVNTFMKVVFSNSADETANYVEWQIQVPDDIDTAVEPRAKVIFKLTGADTGTQRYVISMASVSDSSAYSGTVGTAINIDFAGDGSGASGDVEKTAYTTLTGWGAAVTAGNHWVIRLARDGNASQDASTVDSMLSQLTIEYGKTQ